MKREIATGIQDFENLRVHGDFYSDKTEFIREWWNRRDSVTLITRPRRFGKTLNMSTLNCFFSKKFYHRLVLGLLAENTRDYMIRSNRESGYGRYDVVMEPKDSQGTAVIMEFKVFDTLDDESSMEDTAMNALKQIEEKKYDADLLDRGIPQEQILKYGLAFRGKECLIRKA